MRHDDRPLLWLLVCVGMMWTLPAQAGEWRYAGHDTGATGLGDGEGAITGEPGALPGFSWALGVTELAFTPPVLGDVNGDGVPEAILAYRQAVGAFDLLDGHTVWVTPQVGATHIIGLVDLLGAGVDDQILVIDSDIGGGIHLVDLTTGVLLWSSPLQLASGVHPDEVAFGDLDGDGVDELVFGPRMTAVDFFYAADLSTDDGVPRVVEGTLSGIFRNTVYPAVGDFLPEFDGAEIAMFQRSDLDVHRTCEPADAGASCDDVDGTFCLCPAAFFEALWAWRAMPRPVVVDADGDGVDELLSVHESASLDSGFGLFDLEAGTSGGTPDSTAVPLWYYEYSGQASPSRPTVLAEEPTDIDGDGVLDLVINVWDAQAGELDLAGAAVDDGLDHPGGFSVGVFDLETGALQASLEDRYAFGLADLDGDGIRELVTQTTTAWTFTGGALEAWTLSCDATCELTLAWTSPDLRVIRFPEASDDVRFPTRAVAARPGEGGLLLFDGDDVVDAIHDGLESLSVQGTVPLSTDDPLVAFDDEFDTLLVQYLDQTVEPFDGGLSSLAAPYLPPGRSAARWNAAVLGPDETRATPIVDGHVFWSVPQPASMADADVVVGDQLLFADDLDGDGFVDLVGYSPVAETLSFEVTRFEFDGAGFTQVWTFESVSSEPLAGYGVRSPLVPTSVDVTGDGVADVVLDVRRGSRSRLVALDGLDGALQWLVESDDELVAPTDGPAFGIDVIDGGVYGAADGQLDLVRTGLRYIQAFEALASAPVIDHLASDNSTRTMWADLDLDGTPELVSALSAQASRQQLVAYSLLPTLAELWGPITDLLAPSNIRQAIALAEVDATAGPDLLWASSSGGLDARAGLSGARVEGYPVWMADGELLTAEPEQTQPLSSLLAMDVDGDGHDEAVAGSRAGYVYAIDLVATDGGPALQWGLFVGAPVTSLAAADIDGDGEDELLLSSSDSVARVIDGLGVDIIVMEPLPDECIASDQLDVVGTSLNVDEVAVSVAGVPVSEGIPVDGDGGWSTTVPFPLAAGQVELVASGLVGGDVVVSDSLVLTSEADLDGDGATVCGGDCDDQDPARYPGAEEICDGVDNDCDDTTEEDVDEDGDGYSTCDGQDCDDSEATVHPGAEEDCDTDLDEDCDGLTDDDPDCGTITDDDDSAVDDDDSGADTGGSCDDCDGCSSGGRDPGAAAGGTALALVLLIVGLRRRELR